MPAVRRGAADKWSRRASQAAPDYKSGVETTTADWESSTIAAEAAHKAGITKALAAGSFVKGIKKAGNQYWKQQAATKGANRYSEGVETAKSTYAEGVAPYLAAIEKTVLPPRGPKGDPRNYERSKMMGMELRKVKEGQL